MEKKCLDQSGFGYEHMLNTQPIMAHYLQLNIRDSSHGWLIMAPLINLYGIMQISQTQLS